MSRGLKNCNPGNIRVSGTRYRGEVVPSHDKVFKQFKTITWGYRAIFVLLHTYRVRHGCTTLRQMIARYAPPVENDTDNYLRCIIRWSGIDADEQLDTCSCAVMIPVVAAISRMENGVAAAMPDVEAGWRAFRGNMP